MRTGPASGAGKGRGRRAGIVGVGLSALLLSAAAGQGGPVDTGTSVPVPSLEKRAEAIFAQRSKKRGSDQPRPRPQRPHDLPVVLEGREIGLVKGWPADDAESLRLDLAGLATLLAERAQDSALARLRDLADTEGFGRVADLPADGITVSYDPTVIAVSVAIPPHLRRVVRIDVLGRDNPARGYMVVPNAAFSTYVNVRAALDYVSMPEPDRPDGRGPLSVVFEHAANWRGWVVESEAQFREDSPARWARGPVRLIRDMPDSAIRIQAGDLVNPVWAAQSGRALGGLSIARNFTLTPYRSVQPSGQRDFILEQPSLVEVQVNGRPTRTFRLEPGPYNLANFPGATGTNDVQIRITDAFGRQQTIDFPFFFDGQLLADGVQEFAYTAGYPYDFKDGRIVYDTDRLSFSGYHRLGVSDRLTLGAGVQADRSQAVLGAEALLATPFGTFGLEPQASFGTAAGYAATLRFRDYRSGASLLSRRAVTAQVSWRDSAFGSFGNLTPRNDTSFDASLRVSQPLLEGLTATLGGRYRMTRNPERGDAWAGDLTLRWFPSRLSSLDLTLSHARDDFGDEETGAFISFRMGFDQGRQGADLSIDSLTREKRLDWRYQQLRPVDQWSLALDATSRPGGDRVQGRASYTHQRFLVSVRHDAFQRPAGDGMGIEQRTQLNLSSSLVYADGHVAVTRPVSNSFAIVKPHPRIRKYLVGVDPVDGIWLTNTDRFGPAVVPNMSAYLVRPLLLDVPEVPVGYDIGEDRPAVYPGYRTGAVITVGTDATVSLDGTMFTPDGKPVSLQAGILRPVGSPPRKEIPFFTNRRGRFRVEAVSPGQWELVLQAIPHTPVPVEVPPESEGVKALGEIRLGGG